MKRDDPADGVAGSMDFPVVREEVLRLARRIHPERETESLERGFALFEKACRGTLVGYHALATPYHDERHVLEVTLCCARLLHGLMLSGRPITPFVCDAALIGALFHDIGYLMSVEEGEGSGAQFTTTHVPRGIAFVRQHLGNLPEPLLEAVCQAIAATNHRPTAPPPTHADEAVRLAAQATGTADLIGQMADREYLERLLLLYLEFREAGIPLFADVHDLLEKSLAFYRTMSGRLSGALGNLAPALAEHFAAETGTRRNYYLEAIQRNLDHLARVLALDPELRFDLLRRGGIAARTLERLQMGETVTTG